MSSTDKITILFIADVVGQAGCETLVKHLPELRKSFATDFVIANGENANNNGRGITQKIAKRFFEAGVDVITGGNHTWENRNNPELFEAEDRVIIPANYPDGNIGTGSYVATLKDNATKIAVLNLQGRTFLYPILCPFRFSDEAIAQLKVQTDIIFVDFHAEATAEKIALGWYLDGKVSAVVGTHTHVQTADERILPNGTAYITDAGMTGAHHSVIGTKIENALHRFIYQTPCKFEISSDDPRLSGVVVEINKTTGKAESIKRIHIT